MEQQGIEWTCPNCKANNAEKIVKDGAAKPVLPQKPPEVKPKPEQKQEQQS